MNANQKWHKKVICFSLVALCLLVYWDLPANDFIILDDPHYITANTQIQKGPSADFFLWAFTDTERGLRIPLTWISLMIDYQLYGLWYPGFSFTNLSLHSLNTVLLFFLLMKMTTALWRSAFSAALFAVHPLHVESVAWMTNRKDVLYALIWFLAIWVYVDWTRKPLKLRYGLLVALFAAACLAKPMAVTLPVLLLIIDYWPLERFACIDDRSRLRRGIALVKEKIPLLAISMLVVVDTLLANLLGEGMPSLETIPLMARFQNACLAYVEYLGKMIYPVDLIVFYQHPGTSLSWGSTLAALGLLVMVSAAIVVIRQGYLAAGWMWYLVTLLPVIGLTQAGIQAMADRYTYIPLVGPFIALTWGLAHITKSSSISRYLPFALATVTIVQLSVMASRQVRIWKNDVTVFSHAVRIEPDNFIARNNLGYAFMEKGQYELAKPHFAALIRIDPHDPQGYYQMGGVAARQNRIEEAIGHYRRVLEIAPDFVAAHNNIGNMFSRVKRYAEASEHYRTAIRLAPDNYLPYRNLGMAMLHMGKMEPARRNLQEALDRAPESKKNELRQILERFF